MKYWKVEDVNNGLCTVAEVGTPRPEVVPVVDPPPPAVIDPEAPPVSLREQLSKDALVAYRELGGVEYLKKNPALLDKVLAKSVAPEPVSIVNQVAQVFPEWLKPTRHAYQLSAEVGVDIQDAESVRVRKENWAANLVKFAEKNPDDSGAQRALAIARAALSGEPLLPPPDPE